MNKNGSQKLLNPKSGEMKPVVMYKKSPEVMKEKLLDDYKEERKRNKKLLGALESMGMCEEVYCVTVPGNLDTPPKGD